MKKKSINVYLRYAAMMVTTILFVGCSQETALETPDDVRIKMNLEEVRNHVGESTDEYEIHYLFETGQTDNRQVKGVLPLSLDEEFLHFPEMDPSMNGAYFWLQKAGEESYDCTDLKHIKVDYASTTRTRGWSATAHSRSATGDGTMDVTFESPFATLLIMTTAEDAKAANAAGVDMKDCSTSLRMYQGDEEIMVPNIGTMGETWKTTDGQEYCLLYKNHIMIEEDCLLKGELVISELGKPLLTINCNNIPLKKGKESIYADKFLTTEVIFTITISPSFENDHNIW